MKTLVYFMLFWVGIVVLVVLAVIIWRLMYFLIEKTDQAIDTFLYMRERSKVSDWKKENLK